MDGDGASQADMMSAHNMFYICGCVLSYFFHPLFLKCASLKGHWRFLGVYCWICLMLLGYILLVGRLSGFWDILVDDLSEDACQDNASCYDLSSYIQQGFLLYLGSYMVFGLVMFSRG